MTIISYHSTLFSEVAASPVAVDKTSSQIFLSRGVAGAETKPAPCSNSTSPTRVISFESNSSNTVMVGDAALWSGSGPVGSESPVCGDEEIDDSGSNSASATTCPDASDASTTNPARKSEKFSKSPTSSPLHPFVTDIENEGLSGISSNRSSHSDEDSGKGKAVDRGRTVETGRIRAESIPDREDTAIEIDIRPMEMLSRSNTFFEDPSDPYAILEDSLLEPCPLIPLASSVDEVLTGTPNPTNVTSNPIKSRTWAIPESGSILRDTHRPARALTTVFNECQLQFPSPLPTTSLSNVSRNSLTYATQLEQMTTISSSSSSTSTAIEEGSTQGSPTPATPLAPKLPTEIVQQIFRNLSPVDFNSARHTCRSWFIHSLNKSLLETMLRRGGFSSDLLSETTMVCNVNSDTAQNETWLMSKRISRECTLGPDWLGNGLSKPQSEISTPSGFVNVTSVDFTEVAVHYPGPDSAGTIFTISTCGRFLMAANGCLVYVYELNRYHKLEGNAFPKRSGHLLPVTSIICPRRVLACSMDTSSNRYAIAILLDGRVGLVCDITTVTRHASPPINTPAGSTSMRTLPGPRTSGHNSSESTRMQGTSFLDRVSLNSSSSTSHPSRMSPEPPFVFPGIATTGASFAPVGESEWQDVFQGDMPDSSRTAGPSSRHGSLPRAVVIGRDGQLQEFSVLSQPMEPASTALRVEEGPRSVYRNLCSDDDPPRSVAICPQRRCVAFGCSSGIELHWVDALTGQDLNRWFPLTAPSDFLFFLPPRRSIDSAKKLRLISSAARPSERPAISERSFGSQEWRNPFWERFGWGVNHYVEGEDATSAQGILTRLRIDTGRTSITGRMDCSDHYRAIPLSDGYHILFTDPATGLLCLGSDAPVGGPTKLVRKIWFKGPEGQGSPVAYAGGSNLSWGVKVVAAFGSGPEQSIWLFSVPNDVFTANQGTQHGASIPAWFSPRQTTEAQNTDWIKWWPDDGLQEWLNHVQDPVPGILPRSVWPVKIRGQKIGVCNGVVDLVVDSTPRMTIWAFSKGGIATVWELDDGKHEEVKNIWIRRDGTIRESEGDGDIEMPDVPLPSPMAAESPLATQQQSFDGTSTPSTAITTRCERLQHIEWSHQTIRYDTDGDVLMDDPPYPDRSALVERESTEEVAWESNGGSMYHRRGWWSSRSHRFHMRDVVEERTGIARIDVEIR